MKTQRGFTLVELMISLVVFSFAIAGVLAVAVSMSQGYRDQRANTTAEGAARVPMDFLADAIRQSSPGAPTGVIYDATVAGCLGSAAVTVTDGSATGSGAADGLDIIYASGATVTTLYDPTGAGVTMSSGSLTLNVRDTTGFAVGDHIVLSNTQAGHYLAITAVTGTTDGSLTVSSTCNTGTVYLPGSLVIRAQHALFYVDTTNNILMMNPAPTGVWATDVISTANQPLADGIEDMQLALALDTTNNAGSAMTESATPGSDAWLYNVAGESTPAQGSGYALRAIRVTLIARTLSPLLGVTTAFTRPAAENHAAGTVTDNYRRRVLKTTAEVRNSGESP